MMTEEDRQEQSKKKLRSGFTTGTAATAATKAALVVLLRKTAPKEVVVTLLTSAAMTIPVRSTTLEQEGRCASALVVKDGGDDPDATHRAEIGARVRITPALQQEVRILGGEGVGKVTKPGLEIGIGEAAINPGPLKMINMAIAEVLAGSLQQYLVEVEVFVPQGKKISEKTLNARLGILGGISILGTTGIVRPMSHDSYIATIRSAVSVAEAMGDQTVVLTTGRRSERFAQSLFPELREEAFIQIGDFFKMSLEAVREKKLAKVIHAVFFGKAIKMAQGVPHTHADKAELSMKKLGKWTLEVSGDEALAREITEANTGRHAFFILQEKAPAVIDHVGHLAMAASRKFVGEDIALQLVIFDFEGEVTFDSARV